jgi:Family of unknown function (DUF6134)
MRHLWTASLIASCASLIATSALATTAGRTEFEILMNGRSVGSHAVSVTTSGATATANIAINMRGRVGPISFSYAHRCREVWNGDQLTSASCNDNMNDDPKTIEITRAGAIFNIRGPAYTGTAPGTTLPSSWWRAATVRQTRLINSTSGKVENIRVTTVGAEQVSVAGTNINATKYRLRGGVSNDMWYDSAGRWVKTAFSFGGQRFEYRKRTALAGAPRE